MPRTALDLGGTFLIIVILAWSVGTMCGPWSELAHTVRRELQPFIPVMLPLCYAYLAQRDGGIETWNIAMLLMCAFTWWYSGRNDDDRWKRRRRRLARRVRVAAGGRRLVTTTT